MRIYTKTIHSRKCTSRGCESNPLFSMITINWQPQGIRMTARPKASPGGGSITTACGTRVIAVHCRRTSALALPTVNESTDGNVLDTLCGVSRTMGYRCGREFENYRRSLPADMPGASPFGFLVLENNLFFPWIEEFLYFRSDRPGIPRLKKDSGTQGRGEALC